MTWGVVQDYCEGNFEEVKSHFKVLLGHSGGIYKTDLWLL